MLTLNAIMIGTKRLKDLAAFYEKVLEQPPGMMDEENGFFGWQVGQTYFSILDHSGMIDRTKDPGRIMINFETTRVKEEFDRIKASWWRSDPRTLSNGRRMDRDPGGP